MHLQDARELVGKEVTVHPHYDPNKKLRRVEAVRQSKSYPDKLVFNVEGIEGGILEDYVSLNEELTAPQLALLNELNLTKLLKKANINKQYPLKKYPNRSGNLETPVKPKHKGLMGQPDNPYGTRSDKHGRPSSEYTVHARPTSMKDPTGLTNLGEPLDRGISDENVGDDANMHPSSKKHKPTRLQGPAENPGAQTWTSFGNRYPGTKSISNF